MGQAQLDKIVHRFYRWVLSQLHDALAQSMPPVVVANLVEFRRWLNGAALPYRVGLYRR